MSEEINYDRRRFLGNAAMTVAAAQRRSVVTAMLAAADVFVGAEKEER
jgi:hypothetical protein